MTATCVRCPVTLIPQRTWRALTIGQRVEQRVQGLDHHEARGLCGPCYTAARKQGTLPDRLTMPTDLVSEEWAHLANARRSDKENVAHIAPILGMTEQALQRALERARARGLIGRAA